MHTLFFSLKSQNVLTLASWKLHLIFSIKMSEYLLLYQKITETSSVFLFKPSKIEIYFMFSDLITVKKLAWNVIKSFRYLQLHTYLIFIPFIKKSLLKNQTTCWSQTAFHAKTNQFLKFAILSSLQEHFSNFFAFNLCIVLWTPDDQSL